MKIYTKEERKQIHEALSSAIDHLWDGSDGSVHSGGHEFICHAIDSRCDGYFLAREMIVDRLTIDGDRSHTVQCWLAKQGYIPEHPVTNQTFYKKLQGYRMAWLKELIREFSE